MIHVMKTTLDLREDLLAEANALAARERTTLTRLVEEGLSLRLRVPRRKTGLVADLPISWRTGGLLTGIDPVINDSMLDAADEA